MAQVNNGCGDKPLQSLALDFQISSSLHSIVAGLGHNSITKICPCNIQRCFFSRKN